MRNNHRYEKCVHVLVAETFLNGDFEGYEVNHEDGDKTNNHLENLSWVTHSENIRHAYDNGLIKSVRKIQIIETGEIFSNAAACARAINGDSGNIRSCAASNGRRRCKGYTFRFV